MTDADIVMHAISRDHKLREDCVDCRQLPFVHARLAAARGEPEIDVERLARALDAAYDDAVVHCRCGKTILLDNWPNHRNRKSGRPHRPLAFHAAAAIAAEYERLGSE